MNMKKLLSICLLGIFISLNTNAQTNNFTKDQLIGKKWTKRVTMDCSTK